MIEVHATDLYVLNMRTRFPFRYGIASLTALPHLFVWMDVTIDGKRVRALSSEGLPPKWFTKDPRTEYRDDLADMLHVIESACGFAEQAGAAESVYDLWQRVYAEQMGWATREGYPPLLWSLGVSMVERAVIDGFCRAKGMKFAEAVHRNALGIQLHEIHRELKDVPPEELLPPEPLRRVKVRHTVGLADPLTDADIAPEDAANDGLPQSLEAAIKAYGLTHFKIKLSGDDERDIDRLRRIVELLKQHCDENFAITLDGNEQYKDVESLHRLSGKVCADPVIQPVFAEHLLFIEQPFHRDVALSVDVIDELMEMEPPPPIIIDESDGLLGSAAEALESGYIGASHKNCKGVIKGIANACLIAHLNRADPSVKRVQSGEDLANVGPVALLQDLAVMALLGIDHVERNGHHYFKGLSMYAEDVQQQVLAAHGDLYRRHEPPEGFATLNVRGGAIDIGSVVDAPFGVGFDFDPTRYTPLDQWTFESLM